MERDTMQRHGRLSSGILHLVSKLSVIFISQHMREITGRIMLCSLSGLKSALLSKVRYFNGRREKLGFRRILLRPCIGESVTIAIWNIFRVVLLGENGVLFREEQFQRSALTFASKTFQVTITFTFTCRKTSPGIRKNPLLCYWR